MGEGPDLSLIWHWIFPKDILHMLKLLSQIFCPMSGKKKKSRISLRRGIAVPVQEWPVCLSGSRCNEYCPTFDHLGFSTLPRFSTTVFYQTGIVRQLKLLSQLNGNIVPKNKHLKMSSSSGGSSLVLDPGAEQHRDGWPRCFSHPVFEGKVQNSEYSTLSQI